MKHTRFHVIIGVAVLVCLAEAAAASDRMGDVPVDEAAPPGQADTFGGYATTHILLRLSPGLTARNRAQGGVTIDAGAIDAASRGWGVERCEAVFPQPPRNLALAMKYGLTRTYRMMVPRGTDTRTMAAAFAGLPGVEVAEVDGIGGIAQTIPNDPSFGVQWNFHNTGQSGGIVDADVDAPEAWDIFKGSSDVLVAVIDTGIADDLPEFAGRVVRGCNTYDGGTTYDTLGHGSHGAGTIGAATNNALGIAGLNWNVTLLAIRCLSPAGSGLESQCAAGIICAVDGGADIASMSLQYYAGTQLLHDAVDFAYESGLLLVAAAGNNQSQVAWPARFDHCMAVSATNRSDLAWSGNNPGAEVDVSAPGVQVTSLWLGGGTLAQTGTSMATPHVSGIAALLKGYRCTLTNAQMESIIKATAEDKGTPGWDSAFGWGRVNAHAALLAAGNDYDDGDMNCDCVIDLFDVEPFILALTDPAGYDAQYPGCSRARADINGDGSVNPFDINPLVSLMASR